MGKSIVAIKHALVRHRTALILFLALQLGDLVSTHIGLSVGMYEANPLASGVLTNAGEGVTYALKLLWVVGILAAVIVLEKRYSHIWRAVYIVDAIMLTIFISNSVQATLTGLFVS